jgi:hypothetical protein
VPLANTIQQTCCIRYYRRPVSPREKIPQHPREELLGRTPTKDEIRKAIKKMMNDKAPGDLGMTTDMMKNLPPEALLFYTDLIQEFWNSKETDFESWHTTLLTIVYKGKGNPQDQNNHRETCLKEISLKFLSLIISQ